MSKQNGWSTSILVTAIISAACGSLASVFAKIAFDTAFLDKVGINMLAVKGVCIGLVIVFNAIMLSLYVKVLQAVSALQASLLAFVCNYVISTAVGVILFQEHISLQWVLGAMLMTAGAIRVSNSSVTVQVKARSNSRKSKPS
jgi:drug/metabolite transporter (DMT)-like permease